MLKRLVPNYSSILICSSLFVWVNILIAQYILHMVPCEICYIERGPWTILFILGLFSIFKKNSSIYILSLITIISSIFLSFFHSGVERGFWPSPFKSCQQNVQNFSSLLTPGVPPKPCDMANYYIIPDVSMTELGGIFAIFIFLLLLLSHLKSR